MYPGPGGIHYCTKVAVQSLIFSVQTGECFGFLGTMELGKPQHFQNCLVCKNSVTIHGLSVEHLSIS